MDQAKLNQLKAKVNNIEELKASEIYDAVYSVEDVDPYTILGLLKEVLALIEKGGTNVYYGEKYQENVYFLRDPQTQITELVNLTNELGIEDTRLDALIDALDSTKADVTSIKNVWKYAFNQLFNPASSTLPTANGLTVTNIYGGHHVSGTTDSQYYHKMYNLDTKIGHWYYFTPNFSNKQNVYILGHIDSTSFSTKSGKVFQAGNKFDIYIQIERDNTLDFNVLPILVDLTEMFGSGNEPTTLEGVYEYINPDTYYPYQEKLTDNQIQAIGEIDAIKGIALDNQTNKASKVEVNSLSMYPSSTIDFNYIPNPSTWDSDTYKKVAEFNGFVTVRFTTKNNVQIKNMLETLDQGKTGVLDTNSNPSGLNYWYVMWLPVAKGQTIQLYLERSKAVEFSYFNVRFTHSKEV